MILIGQLAIASTIAAIAWSDLARRRIVTRSLVFRVHLLHAALGLSFFLIFHACPLNIRGGLLAGIGIGLAPISALVVLPHKPKTPRGRYGESHQN